MSLDGQLMADDLVKLTGFSAICLWSEHALAKSIKQALAQREGPIIPLLMHSDLAEHCRLERHICINTTASGGNVSLLSGEL